eukprot:10442580-Ditylum_brightwellii.AAC.1
MDIPMASTFILKTMHLQQANATFTDCDAKACYDKVITIIIALAESKARLSTSACRFLAKALKQMNYSMVTVYEPSEISNQHAENSPVHAPPVWTLNVDICKTYYNKEAHRFHLSNPSGNITIQ